MALPGVRAMRCVVCRQPFYDTGKLCAACDTAVMSGHDDHVTIALSFDTTGLEDAPDRRRR